MIKQGWADKPCEKGSLKLFTSYKECFIKFEKGKDWKL